MSKKHEFIYVIEYTDVEVNGCGGHWLVLDYYIIV